MLWKQLRAAICHKALCTCSPSMGLGQLCTQQALCLAAALVNGERSREGSVSAPRAAASHHGKQPGIFFFFFFLLAQNSRSRCMKRWKTKSIIYTGGRSLQKLDNSVFLLAAMFSFLVNRKLTSRHLVTWVRDASWRQCPPASTCPEGLIPHPRTAWPHSLH